VHVRVRSDRECLLQKTVLGNMRQLTALALLLSAVCCVQASIFSVGHAGGINQRNGKIRFVNVISDAANAWNSRRSRYQVPTKGYYVLSFHALSRPNQAVTLSLKVNNQEKAAAYGDGSGYHTASNSVILFLERRDTISLHVASGDIHESGKRDRNYVTLSGFLLPTPSGVPRPPAPAFGAGSGAGSGGGGFSFGSPAAAAAPAGAPEEEEVFSALKPEAGGGGPN